MDSKKILVVGAHAADFVWRAAGTIATVTSQGGTAHVAALSYGERGESGDLWKEPNQTVENVKKIRHAQSAEAAGILGAEFSCFDFGDYPLNVSAEGMDQVVELIRQVKPDILVTHTPLDPFNPDHPVAYQVVQRARLLASGAGVASAFERITPPDLYFFEPHQPELCDFKPNVFVDITAVMEKKKEAMAVVQAQSYMKEYYAELAARRGTHARRISGNKEVSFAEALQRDTPWVVKAL